MPSVSITIRLTLSTLLFTFLTAVVVAQENSPFSRYGIGDLYPSQHIINRGMGGFSVAYTDLMGQSVNFSNPSTYSQFRTGAGGGVVLYDLGVTIDSRSLRSAVPLNKYNATNFSPTYVAVGIPLKRNLGLAFGLKPYSRINYNIIDRTRLGGIDSAQYLYVGSGGLNQAFIGLGKKWGDFSLGFNTGYLFGSRKTDTRLAIINTDTAPFQPFYYKANVSSTTFMGKVFLQLGSQYEIKLKTVENNVTKMNSEYLLTLGATAMLKQTFNGSQDKKWETFEYDNSGGIVTVDSVYTTTGRDVKVELPATYNFGFMLHKVLKQNNFALAKWMVGAELEMSKWTQFRNEGMPDKLSDYWQLRIGGQLLPSINQTSVLGRSSYRAGFSYGRDYINADGNGLKTWSGTFGMGIPVKVRSGYSEQFTIINLAAEYGKRGSKVNNITENFFRLSMGLSLSDVWFRKRKYD